jgi:hypothetical protein
MQLVPKLSTLQQGLILSALLCLRQEQVTIFLSL